MTDTTGTAAGLGDPALAAEIVAAVDSRHEETVDFLDAMVREPSTLGREQGIQRLMADAFARLGLEVDAFEIDERAIRDLPGYSPALIPYDGRGNVVGVHRPAQATGRSLIFNGHVDVVPTGPEELWTTPPFAPSIRDGRMYGRGAGDMKSGVAAYTAAFSALRNLGLQPAAPVCLQSVIEEEGTGNGALACLARGYRADAAVIPEPFDHTLLTAQVGVAWLVLEVTGRPAHVLDTSAGANAIEAAYRINEHLKILEERWNRPESRHPAFRDHVHPINFNLGRIEGGEWTSSVPTRCTAEFRLGFYPGVPLGEVRAAAERVVDEAVREDAALEGFSVKVTWRGFQAEGCTVDPDLPMMACLRDAHRAVRHDDPADIAITCTTDIRFFNLYGDTPSTCYGPEGGGFHGIDEWVSLDSLRDTTRVLALFLAAWCGVERRPG